MSAFQFGPDLPALIDATGSVAGFEGECWSPWLWFDVDSKDDIEAGRRHTVRLASTLCERYVIGEDDMLLFFSGAKGFHAGLPTNLWSPSPSVSFAATAKHFAIAAAERAGVKIDIGVYDRVRPFRAPNSRHPKTGMHKRQLTFAELTQLKLEAIVELANEPTPFDVPNCSVQNEQAAADWRSAAEVVKGQSDAKAARKSAGAGATLNRATLEFIRNGVAEGDRHRMLLSAAANLAEFGCPPSLAFALLEEAGLDCGLPPKDVRRQIECGLAMVNVESSHPELDPITCQCGSSAMTTTTKCQSCSQVYEAPF